MHEQTLQADLRNLLNVPNSHEKHDLSKFHMPIFLFWFLIELLSTVFLFMNCVVDHWPFSYEILHLLIRIITY